MTFFTTLCFVGTADATERQGGKKKISMTNQIVALTQEKNTAGFKRD